MQCAVIFALAVARAAPDSPVCVTPGLPTLDELAHKYGSGKSVKSRGGSANVGGRADGGGHGFSRQYARLLERRRASVRRVLEFGVFFGASILMWRDYCPAAEVIGVDTFAGQLGHGPRFANPRKFLELWQNGSVGPRIRLVEADQSQPADLERVVAAVSGDGFDLVVDDGSHKNRDQQLTLAHTFPLVAPGGVYVLEDIHTSAQTRYDEPRLTYNTSMMMMMRYEAGQGISSKHMSSSQITYLERWLEGCVRVVPVGARSVLSMTCICYKRATPLPEGTRAPQPVDVAGRLYDLQAGEAVRSPKGGHLQVRSEKRC